MAQGNIIKCVKHFHVHIVQAAYHNLFRFTTPCSGYKLMDCQDIPFFPVNLHTVYHKFHCLLIAFGQMLFLALLCFFLHYTAHCCRPDKRKQIYGQFSIFVCQCNGLYKPVINRRYINASAAHKLRPKGNPFCRVVVPTDKKHTLFTICQRSQKLVKYLYRFR